MEMRDKALGKKGRGSEAGLSQCRRQVRRARGTDCCPNLEERRVGEKKADVCTTRIERRRMKDKIKCWGLFVKI